MKIKHMFMLPAIAGILQIHAQQGPTVTSPSLPALNGTNAGNFWSRAGNTLISGTNNIFGTLWNSPIYTQTNGQNRMKLNGNISYPVGTASANDNRNGFLLLTNNPNIWTGGSGLMSAAQGAFSLLHLVGDDGGALQTFGFRTWMRNGITMSNNFDAGFIGIRKMPNTAGGIDDVSDFVINWSDNVGTTPGIRTPDNLVFNFTTADGTGNDDLIGSNQNGREVMRMNTNGNVGIGPRFNNTWQPQSTLHQHQENSAESWMQITNQLSGGTANASSPTAITATDGLRWGINGANTGYFYNQENQHLLFSTNHNASNPFGGTNERMRITHIGATGTPNPNSVFPNDITRVSISHNPSTPIDRPMSLLHLGYNTGGTFTPTSTDGWRPWMDVGAFIAQGSDNAYFGLKTEPGANNDRQDAIISWGDNYLPTNILGQQTGIDKLRIIFTSPAAGQIAAGPGAMSTTNGLEFVRYVPFHNTSLNINDPRTGFGDFESLTPVGTINPGNTIEINSIMANDLAAANTNVTGSYVGSTGASGLRFRDLTSNSTIVPSTETAVDHTKALSVDNLGNVVLINNGGGGNGLGNACGAATQNLMTSDWEIPTNNFNYRFIAPAGTNPWGTNYVGIGTTCAPTANFDVVSPLTSNNPNAVTAVNVSQTNLGNSTTFSGIAVGVASDVNASNKNNIGVAANARNATNNYGVYSTANAVSSGSSNQRNVGVYAEASRAPQNFAMRGRSVSNPAITTGLNVGGWFSAENNQTRIGVMGDVNGAPFILPTLFPNNYAIGVYGWNPSPSSTDYAGYFEGKVNVNGALTVYGVGVSSDATLKTNVDTISNATALLNQVEAKSFYYDTTNANGMKFSSQKQYGVIAQQVETVLPELVTNNYKPAMIDSAGTVVYAAKSFKTVNYNAFIGLLIKANQEQQAKIDSLTSKLNSKDSIQDARLTALEAAIASCCASASTRQSNSPINQLDIELSDKDAIVLNQNVPNPFAEQTTITYNVPASVNKAQIIFYNSAGQIIQTVDVKTRGNGKVNVFASDLSSGLYHYTLVADGKVVDSKKMVRE